MNRCITKRLIFREVSGCLIEKPECVFALKFGFSFVCRHQDHTKFHAHTCGVMTRSEANERYEMLRLKRRNEFVTNLDDESRRLFCDKFDFLNQPLTYVEAGVCTGAGMPGVQC